MENQLHVHGCPLKQGEVHYFFPHPRQAAQADKERRKEGEAVEEELLVWLKAIDRNKGMKTAVTIVADHFRWSIRGTELRFWSEERPKGPHTLGRQLLDRILDEMDPPPGPHPWRSILRESSGRYVLSVFGLALMRLLEAKLEKAP